MKPTKPIYFDFASTCPIDPRVLRRMLQSLKRDFGNTMSLHQLGQEAKVSLEEARETIANFINAKPSEIIFTSSATESNNLALKGVAFSSTVQKNHIIISSIEHPCVRESAKWLETKGFEISMVRVDRYGRVDISDLRKKIKKNTILVSIMHANNEVGTIQPIKEIGGICRKEGILFHTDAVQTFGKIPIDVKELKVDLLTASSHKIYGPKGVAILFVREGVKISPLLHGGGHEMGLRSSTVNLPAIVGFAEAVKICRESMKEEAKRIEKLSKMLTDDILKNIKGSRLNGDPKNRIPHILNFSFPGFDAHELAIELDLLGIAVSTGSACSTFDLKPSSTLMAMGLSEKEAFSSLRISLGRWTRKRDIEILVKSISQIIERKKKCLSEK